MLPPQIVTPINILYVGVGFFIGYASGKHNVKKCATEQDFAKEARAHTSSSYWIGMGALGAAGSALFKDVNFFTTTLAVQAGISYAWSRSGNAQKTLEQRANAV